MNVVNKAKNDKRRRKKLIINLIIFIIVLFLVIIAPPITCCYSDIDLNSGAMRHKTYVLGVLFEEKIDKSPIFKELQKYDLIAEFKWIKAEFKYQDIYNPFVIQRETYRYGKAIGAFRILSLLLEDDRLKNKEEIIKDFMMNFQNGKMAKVNAIVDKLMND